MGLKKIREILTLYLILVHAMLFSSFVNLLTLEWILAFLVLDIII